MGSLLLEQQRRASGAQRGEAIEDRFVGKYPISVAANFAGVPEHRLRAFENAGLFEPHRTEGGTRLYSDADLELIERIAELVDRGINYAGIREILEITEVPQSEESEEGTPEDEASDARVEAQNKEEV